MSRNVWISYPSQRAIASKKRTLSGASINHPERPWKSLGCLLVWQVAIEIWEIKGHETYFVVTEWQILWI